MTSQAYISAQPQQVGPRNRNRPDPLEVRVTRMKLSLQEDFGVRLYDEILNWGTLHKALSAFLQDQYQEAFEICYNIDPDTELEADLPAIRRIEGFSRLALIGLAESPRNRKKNIPYTGFAPEGNAEADGFFTIYSKYSITDIDVK